MTAEKKNVVLHAQDGDDRRLHETFAEHDEALVAHGKSLPVPQPLNALPPELQRAVQALCDTYETLDLRIETTLANAASDFVTALSEIEGHEDELRQLVARLLNHLRGTADAVDRQQIVLRLSYQSEDDLTRQVLSTFTAQGDLP